MVTESEREFLRNAARTRNTKPELPKTGAIPDSPLKHSGEEVISSCSCVSPLYVHCSVHEHSNVTVTAVV